MVIYKDDNIIAINKPSGIAVHGTNTTKHIDYLTRYLTSHFNQDKPRLVHI